MRVNLGCGDDIHEGYVNVDEVPNAGVDVCSDALAYLAKLPDNSVEEIYSKHFIEHLSLSVFAALMREMVRVLKPGGMVIVECPDLRKLCECFLSNMHGWRWVGPHGTNELSWHDKIYGGGKYGRHLQGFDIERLRREFLGAGLEITRCVPWASAGELVKADIRIEGRKPA